MPLRSVCQLFGKLSGQLSGELSGTGIGAERVATERGEFRPPG